jgi:hypothetical protein
MERGCKESEYLGKSKLESRSKQKESELEQ